MRNRNSNYYYFINLILITIILLTFTINDLYSSKTSVNNSEPRIISYNTCSEPFRSSKENIKSYCLNKDAIRGASTSKILNLEEIQINITSSGDYFEGYNLFELTEIDRTGSGKDRTLFLISTEGEIVAEMKNYRHPAKFIEPRVILCGRENSNGEENAVLWDIQNNKTQVLDFWGHHDFEWNPLNDTFFTFVRYQEEIDGEVYSFDLINEYTGTGDLVWSLDTQSFISHHQWCPFQDMELGARDVTHSNTIFFDVEEDVFYYNSRNVNTFYKIDHKTGEILWGLGEYGNFTLFDLAGRQKQNLFYHAHAVEKVDENTFILFDNDLHNLTNSNNKKSRILEITINEKTMTANESWVWTAPREYYSFALGDADRLPNGNRLGTFGMDRHLNTNIGARIVEINDSGHIVWEMNFPNSDETGYRIYHTDRVRFNPVVDSPPDIKYLGDDLYVTWRTWYNFRTNRKLNDSYTVYLDDNPIHNGEHVFDKFWRSTDLTVNLGPLNLGTHNIGIAFEENHIITNSIIIESSSNNDGLIDGFTFLLVLGSIFVICIRAKIYRK